MKCIELLRKRVLNDHGHLRNNSTCPVVLYLSRVKCRAQQRHLQLHCTVDCELRACVGRSGFGSVRWALSAHYHYGVSRSSRSTVSIWFETLQDVGHDLASSFLQHPPTAAFFRLEEHHIGLQCGSHHSRLKSGHTIRMTLEHASI